jgi:hypothetical protein
MSGFLTHLASVALGRAVEGAAGPSLPPRYAALEPDGPIAEAEEVRVEPGPTPSTGSARAAPGDVLAPGHPDRGPARFVAPTGEPGGLSESEASAGSITVATEPGSRSPSDAAPPGSPPSPPRAAEPSAIPSARAREPRGAVLLPTPPSLAAASIRPGEAVPVHAASARAPRRAPPPSAAGPTPLAPLTDGAVAARTGTNRPASPVIHVTIDRIDVRAPAPSRPVQPARRAPAEPSLSLSDFLAAGSPRPRQ